MLHVSTTFCFDCIYLLNILTKMYIAWFDYVNIQIWMHFGQMPQPSFECLFILVIVSILYNDFLKHHIWWYANCDKSHPPVQIKSPMHCQYEIMTTSRRMCSLNITESVRWTTEAYTLVRDERSTTSLNWSNITNVSQFIHSKIFSCKLK